MHWANTRLGSLDAAPFPEPEPPREDAELELPPLVEEDEFCVCDPQALRAAARVRAMTARTRVCVRVFIETP
ncbi:hypothetical protein HMPREF1980_01580 [Actinomyces sp. oral taxon 172 str. F0311]|nr:hypothetical protein HMPREF1980_01580 [Actinomyces sp. oral taxon 172 str. F0311]